MSLSQFLKDTAVIYWQSSAISPSILEGLSFRLDEIQNVYFHIGLRLANDPLVAI